VLAESDVYELERQLAGVSRRRRGRGRGRRGRGPQSARAVSAGGVTERKVRGDEVGAVLVSVGRRHPTHVDHLRVYSRESSVGSVEPSVGLGWVHYSKSTKDVKGLC